ncbi:MAG: hypothetical protein WCL00_13805, partial [Bacteroidota bacterium]
YTEMNNSVRAKSFTFPGPVTVVIGALTNDNKIIRAAVDVNVKDGFLKVRAQAYQENLSYPRNIFRLAGKPEDIYFPVFFAIYDDDDDNELPIKPDKRINFFDRLGSNLPEEPFFGRSHRDSPIDKYGFTLGRKFPLSDPEWLLNSPDAKDTHTQTRFNDIPGGDYRYADAMLIGAKIGYNGTVLESKTPSGKVISITGDLTMEPLFFEIDFRSDQYGGILHMADMHIGNVAQGFVASAYYGITGGRGFNGYTNLPENSYSIPNNELHATGTFTGQQPNPGVLGFNSGGEGRYITILSVSWQKVPFFSDYDFSGTGLVINP